MKRAFLKGGTNTPGPIVKLSNLFLDCIYWTRGAAAAARLLIFGTSLSLSLCTQHRLERVQSKERIIIKAVEMMFILFPVGVGPEKGRVRASTTERKYHHTYKLMRLEFEFFFLVFFFFFYILLLSWLLPESFSQYGLVFSCPIRRCYHSISSDQLRPPIKYLTEAAALLR